MISVWFQQGTEFDLEPEAMYGFRCMCAKAKEDVYITSGREGDHMPGSLHYSGLAWDMRKSGYKTKADLYAVLPGGAGDWDIVEYDWGYHVEYDPA